MAYVNQFVLNGAPPRSLVFLMTALLTSGFLLSTNVTSAQTSDRFSFGLESDDAFPDSTLPDKIFSYFDDTDESPLECASIDLNGDGKKEKFVPNKYLEGTGLCPWLVFDSKAQQLIGRIDAKIIYVRKNTKRGFAVLEGYQKQGVSRGSVTYYEFDGREYKDFKTVELIDEQIDAYFEERKNLPHPGWLRPGE